LSGCRAAMPNINMLEISGKPLVTKYIDNPCPKCGRNLRVRTTYIGRKIACNHCNHGFLVKADTAPERGALPPDKPAGTMTREPELEQLREQVRALDEESRKLRTELAARSLEQETDRQRLRSAQEEIVRFGVQVHDLQGQLAQAREYGQRANGSQREVEELR